MKPLVTNERFMRLAMPLGIGSAAVVLWQLAVTSLDVPKYIVPSPLLVFQTLVVDRGLLFQSLFVTLQITFAAFACALVVGTLLAFFFVQSRWIEISLFPYAVLLQVTPIVAIAPLIIIWVKQPPSWLFFRSSPTPRSACAASIRAW
jgi:NitT/TauT family transport system permease protein